VLATWIFLASAYGGGWPVLSLAVLSSHRQSVYLSQLFLDTDYCLGGDLNPNLSTVQHANSYHRAPHEECMSGINYPLLRPISQPWANSKVWIRGQCISGLATYFPDYAGTKLSCFTIWWPCRNRGWQKMWWGDMIQQDMKVLQLKKEDTGDRKKWRKRIRVADLSPGTD